MAKTTVPRRKTFDFSDTRGTVLQPYFFRAMKAGVCAACDTEYEVGDFITDDEGDRVGKECCYSDTPPRPDKVCPGCHLELPRSGVCGVCE